MRQILEVVYETLEIFRLFVSFEAIFKTVIETFSYESLATILNRQVRFDSTSNVVVVKRRRRQTSSSSNVVVKRRRVRRFDVYVDQECWVEIF